MTVSSNLISNIQELKKSLNEISVYDLNVYTAIELYYNIAKKLNEVITELGRFEGVLSEEVIKQNDKLLYLVGEGLTKEVINKINSMIQDGTMNTLINHNIFRETNVKIDSLENRVNEVATRGTTQEVLINTTKLEIEKQIQTGALYNETVELVRNGFSNLNLGVIEQGGIETNNGTNGDVINNRLRTKDYIYNSSKSLIKVICPTGYNYIISFYDMNKIYIGSNAGWLGRVGLFIANEGYFRIQVKRDNDSVIQVSEISNFKFQVAQEHSTLKNINMITGSIDSTNGNPQYSLLSRMRSSILNKNNVSRIKIPMDCGLIIFKYTDDIKYISSTEVKQVTLNEVINITDILNDDSVNNFRFVITKNNYTNFTNDEITKVNQNLKGLYLNEERIKLPTLDNDIKKVINIKSINFKRGIYSNTDGGVYVDLQNSICSVNLIDVKKGGRVYLSNYDNYILTIREFENNRLVNSFELKTGEYIFPKDTTIGVNIIAWDKFANTSLTSIDLNDVVNDVAKLLILIENTVISDTNNNSILQNGVTNTIEKAKAIANITWSPLKNIPRHNGYFTTGTNYKGMPYSSARKTDTFIGSNISFNTFLSALKNPNSVIYTENLNQSPYNQANAFTYYGMVCSTFVAYCMGMKLRPTSVDWEFIEGMHHIKKNIDNIEIGDSLLYKDPVGTDGHVMLIGDVKRDTLGKVTSVVVYESWPPTINTNYFTREGFINGVLNTYDIYRYEKISVSPKETFEYNFSAEEYLNTDYGNKANYRIGKDVKVTILNKNYTHLLVYKNNAVTQTIQINLQDIITLSNLTEGNYKICLSSNGTSAATPFIEFKVVNDNTNVTKEGNNIKITLGSNSGKPAWFSWNDNTHVVFKSRDIKGDEKNNGFIIDTFKTGNWLVKVYYENEFGIFSSNVFNVTI